VIHFIAIGGTGVSAKVLEWNTNTVTGNQTVPGVGFQPNVVIHAHIDSGSTATPPYQVSHGFLGLGAMDSDGDQWALSFYAQDGAGTSVTVRTQQPGVTIRTPTGYTGGGPLYQGRALLPSDGEGPTMISDGFKVKWTDVFGGARKMVSLALSGIQVKAGNFKQVTAGPTVTGVEFQPSLVMLASFQSTAMPNDLTMAHSRLGLGAADGTRQHSSAISDSHGENRSIAYSRADTTSIFLKSDNTTLAIQDTATLTTFAPDSFTLNWAPNDGVDTELLYLAFAPLEMTAVGLTALNATRYDSRVLVDWRTGYEVDNLGFNIYRELNGQRTRVNQSLVAGSGLMAGQGTATHGEQRYAVWDFDTQASDRSTIYWLEDLDFNGASTLHGPVTPVDGGLQVPPEIAPSSALRDLGTRLKRRGKVFSTAGAQLTKVSKSPSARARSGDVPVEVQMQRVLAAQAAIKIGVRHSGWHRVTQPELVAAGLDARVDPQSLRLFVDGVEQAMTVTGSMDGRFDATDAIEFYGTGVDTPHTDTRTYWLAAGGRGGQRVTMHGAPGRDARANLAASFPFTLQQKERSIYFAALRNGDEENWFGAFISEEPADLTFNVSNILSGAAAEIDVTLQGVTSDPSVDSDHQVAILMNGTEVGTLTFDGQSKYTQSFAVPAGIVADGVNVVTIVAQGGEADYSLVDVVRLNYPHIYRADADLLRFTADGPGDVTVTGFASSAIRVVDITDPMAVEELRGTVRPDGGLSAVTIRVPNQGSRTLLAFTNATITAPAFVRANATSQWSAAANGADYVAITHAEFAGSLTPLLERRKQRGLSVAQIDIEDVYDEFSFGEKTPQALRDFVTLARTQWKRAPRFLTLVGDATMDPRDYAGFGDADFVPTKQIAMAQIALETASDDWFADTDDDGLPELAIGRLPVRNAQQAQDMVAKLLAYEDGNSAGWTRSVLLVADQNDDMSDFEASTEALVRFVPRDYAVQRVFTGVSGPEVARLQLLDAVNRGQLIVNYTGHGSVRIWGTDGTLLTTDDVASAWHNGSQLPLVVAMNCLNGFFHGIYDEESLAESLLRAVGGGAVATWASSGLTDSATQARVNQELFRLLFSDSTLTMGQAAAMAKRAVTGDVRRSWVFFGDPALHLKGITSTVR
jgi:hypothetical protein